MNFTKKELNLLLPIESIPPSSWGVSLSNKLPKERWDKFRREVYKRANYSCEACGCTSKELHCHESWAFYDKKGVQHLSKVRCLCETCHEATHFYRSSVVFKEGKVNKLWEHLKKVNGLSEEELRTYVSKINVLIKRRANRFYKVVVGKFELF